MILAAAWELLFVKLEVLAVHRYVKRDTRDNTHCYTHRATHRTTVGDKRGTGDRRVRSEIRSSEFGNLSGSLQLRSDPRDTGFGTRKDRFRAVRRLYKTSKLRMTGDRN